MLSRHWKQLATLHRNPDCLRFIGEPELSDSSSSNSSNMLPRVEMPSNTYTETFLLGLGGTLGREDGSWEDVNYYFMECGHDQKPLEYYYRDWGGQMGPRGGNPTT